MKKLGFLIFIIALAVGLIFTPNCSYSSGTSVKGSGTSKTEQRNVAGFTRIDAGGAMNVEVDANKDFSVSVEADDNLLQHIKTEVSGDTLKIYSEGKISPSAKLNVKISMPSIRGLDVSGASDGKITNVRADSFELKASGASEVAISGEAKNLEAEASGASKIDAENLKVEDGKIEASGASSAVVLVASNLEADASGASKIYYAGEPKNIKQNASGASSINRK